MSKVKIVRMKEVGAKQTGIFGPENALIHICNIPYQMKVLCPDTPQLFHSHYVQFVFLLKVKINT